MELHIYNIGHRRQVLYRAVKQHFNDLHINVCERSFVIQDNPQNEWLNLAVGEGKRIHYEFRITKGARHHEWRGIHRLDVALHFEDKVESNNEVWLQWIKSRCGVLRSDPGIEFYAGKYGTHDDKRAVMFRIPFDQGDIALKATHLMKILIEATWPLIQERLGSL